MARYMLSHRHEPHECRPAFAAWHGFGSPLRGHATLGSCVRGDHAIWWTIDAGSKEAAIGQLPHYVAERTEITEVGEVEIP